MRSEHPGTRPRDRHKRRVVVPAVGFALLSFGLHAPIEGQATQGDLTAADRTRIEAFGEAFARGLSTESAEERARLVADVYAETTIDQQGVARLAGFFAQLRNDLGPVEYHHSEVAEVDMGSYVSRILHVYVRSTTRDQWQDIQLRLEADPPYRIKELGFLAAVAEPVYVPNGAITDASTLAWLDGYIDRLVADEDLSGSILIAREDQPILERTFGYADALRTRPVSTDTRFNLASGNKMFTALAVASLVEEGRLDYEATLGRFFPDFPDPDFADHVTVGHLLSHTSGIGDYWTQEYEAAWDEIDALDELLPFVYAAGTSFEPGTRFEYSNSNFLLAGLIIERVTGQNYFDFVRDRIYEPLGMAHSGSFVRASQNGSLAEPLVRDEDDGWTAADQPLRGSSAGGGYSTARDVLRFVRGLVEGEVVSQATLSTMLRRANQGLDAPMAYGYGFILSNEGGMRSFGHGGTAPGTNFELRYFPSEQLTLVLFSNQDNGAYDDLRRNVIKLITGER